MSASTKDMSLNAFTILELGAFHDLFFFLLISSVRSTNILRTIESAKCLVAGLFQQKQKGRAETCSMLLIPFFCLISSIYLIFYLFCNFLFYLQQLCLF